jgi:hypothetical protein
MRNLQYLTSRHRNSVVTARGMEQTPDTPDAVIAAALDALNDMGNIVTQHCFIQPENLTEDRITAYALALMRLRECASAAGIERLENACDALAVTVSRLIEDRGCACREKGEALTRFVAHAKAMIQMSIDYTERRALPAGASPVLSDRTGVENNARVSM